MPQEHEKFSAVFRHFEHLSSCGGYSRLQLPHLRRTFAPQPGHFMTFATLRGSPDGGGACVAGGAAGSGDDPLSLSHINAPNAKMAMRSMPTSNITSYFQELLVQKDTIRCSEPARSSARTACGFCAFNQPDFSPPPRDCPVPLTTRSNRGLGIIAKRNLSRAFAFMLVTRFDPQ